MRPHPRPAASATAHGAGNREHRRPRRTSIFSIPLMGGTAMCKATTWLKSAVALAAAVAVSGNEALGQGSSGCRGAGPPDRPSMGWSRIEEGRTYSAYLDFGSFC